MDALEKHPLAGDNVMRVRMIVFPSIERGLRTECSSSSIKFSPIRVFCVR